MTLMFPRFVVLVAVAALSVSPAAYAADPNERVDDAAVSTDAGGHAVVLTPCHNAAPGIARPIAEVGAGGQPSAPSEPFVIEHVQGYFGVEDFHLIVRSVERSVDFKESVLDQRDLRDHGVRRHFRTTLSPDLIARIGALVPDLLSPISPCLEHHSPGDPAVLDATSRWVTVERAGVKRTLRESEIHDISPELFALLDQAKAQACEHLVETTDARRGTLRSLGTQRILGIVAADVGAAGIGVGLGFALGSRLDVGRQETTNRTISIVGFAAGGAMLVGGLILILTARPSNRLPAIVTLVPGIVPGGAEVSWGREF